MYSYVFVISNNYTVDTKQLMHHVKQLEQEIIAVKESYGVLAIKVLID